MAALTWAANVTISGRADAQMNARKVLIWLTAHAHTIRKWHSFGKVNIQTGAAAEALRMNLRTLYRSLERLQEQGHITDTHAYGHGRTYQIMTHVFGNN